LRIPANRGLEEATDHLAANLAPFQRFYGSPTSIHAGVEIYHFTLAPAYLGRSNVISPLFGGLVGGANNLVHSAFRKTLWKSRNLTDLFHVDAVITSKENRERYPLQEELYRVGVDNGHWIVYDRKEPSQPFYFTDAPPVLVVGDATQWLEANEDWLDSVESLPDLKGLTFLVWERSSRRGRTSSLPLDTFAGVYLTDPGFDPDSFFAEGELADYLEGGGRIYCRKPLERSDLDCPVVDPEILAMPEATLRDAGSAWKISSLFQEEDRHRATITADQPGFLLVKIAFYRGWSVTVDGRPQHNYSLSPGFNSVYLPAGEHIVEFRYRGANASRMGNWVSLLTLVLLVGFSLRPTRDGSPTEDEADRRQGSALVILPFVALAGVLGFLYVNQAVLGIPVPVSPQANEEMPAGLMRLRWNPIPGDDVTYDVQIAREDPEFQDLFLEEYDLEGNRSPRIRVPRDGNTYYWRIRSKSKGQVHRWTDPIPFRMR
jgi:hypothetical protein